MRKNNNALIAVICAASMLAVAALLFLTVDNPAVLAESDAGLSTKTAVSNGDMLDTEAGQMPPPAPGSARIATIGAVDGGGLTPSLDTAPVERTIEVKVIRAQTREPVPRTTVRWWSLRDAGLDRERMEQLLAESQLEVQLPPSTKDVATDAEGRAEIPLIEEGVLAIASSEVLWGYGIATPDDVAPLHIEVVRDADIRVRVEDRKKNAIPGARVALRLGYLHNPDDFQDCLTATANAVDGVAILRHAEHVLRQAFDLPEIYQTIAVASAAVARERNGVPIDRESLPRELTLVCEPSGTCEVKVVDTTGVAVTEPVDVRLSVVDEEGESAGGDIRRGVRGGIALFEQVSLNSDLVAVVTPKKSSLEHVAHARGPVVAGGHAEITVQLGSETALLSAGLVAEDGTPIPRARMSLTQELWEDGELQDRIDLGRTETDQHGIFNVYVSSRSEQSRTLKVVVLDKIDQVVGTATKELASFLSPGVTTDVGAFKLDALPIIAVGRVVTADQAPADGATVTASTDFGNGYSGDKVGSAKTGANGMFELRGEKGTQPLIVRASKGDLAGSSKAHSGDTDVRIELGKTGELQGVVLLPPSLKTSGWCASVWNPDFYGAQTLDETGHFTIHGVVPGSYTFWVGCNSVSWWFTADDVSVTGGTSTPPEFNPLDLRDLRRIEITVVDQQNELIDKGSVFAHSEHSQNSYRLLHGKATILSQANLDVTIRSPGFVLVRQKNVAASQKFVMSRGPELRFSLAPGFSLPSPPEQLSLSLEQDGDTVGFGDYPSLVFDANGRARCPAPFFGSVNVHLVLNRRRQWKTVYVQSGADRVITIDKDHVEPFDVTWDNDKYLEALKELREGE